jgi:predicted ATP-dependent endonuclease of OLD family
MKIAKIELENFLSFEKISLDLSENLNIILGKNESGKSNFLKALKVFNSENLNYQNIANRNNYLDKKDVIIKIFFEINDAEKQSLENKIEKDNPGIECIFGNFFYFEKIISHDNKIKLNSNFLTN